VVPFGDPYAPLGEALAHYLGRRSPIQLRADLRGCAWLVKLLPELADAPIEPLPAWTLSPAQERRLLFGAVGRALANVAGAAGTLLVLDDLHWLAADGLDLLLALVRSADLRLRVVGAYRDSELSVAEPLAAALAEWAAAGLVRQHTLGPLAPGDAAHLFDALVAGASVAAGPGVRERVLHQAGGVPFFLVSCAQALWRDEELPQGAVPWDVAQSVRQRIAALPPLAVELLGVAAAAGPLAVRRLLTQVVARPDREVVAALEVACGARLLEEAAGNYPAEAGYRFAHDLIREVVEVGLGEARRTLLHLDIAQALEGLPGEPAVDQLAYHYAQTDDHERAAQWLERAGDRAASGFAGSAALAAYTAARARVQAAGMGGPACSRLDEKLGDLRVVVGEVAQAQEDFARAREGEADAARRAALWRKEGDTWARRGEHVRAVACFDAGLAEPGALPGHLRAALALGRADVSLRQHEYDATVAAVERAQALLDDEPPGRASHLARAQAHFLVGLVAFHRGDEASMEEHLRQSLAHAERGGDPTLVAKSWGGLGLLSRVQGDTADAVECTRRGLAMAERGAEQAAIAELWSLRGALTCTRGDLAQAEECYRTALGIAERVGDQSSIASVESDLGFVAWARGDLAQAEGPLRHALEVFDRLGDQFGSLCQWHALGAIACDRGDLSRAAQAFRLARRGARRIGDLLLQQLGAIGQARARLLGGRVRQAAALLEHARALLDQQNVADVAVSAALATAELSLSQVPGDGAALSRARAAAEEALCLAERQDRRREEAQARRLLGQCALAGGAPAEAEVHLRASLAMLGAMGARLEAARTRRALAETLLAEAGTISEEAQQLIAEARAQFASSGASLDLAEAVRLKPG
jgi:tetratricopeptide (TPR) repeat protein